MTTARDRLLAALTSLAAISIASSDAFASPTKDACIDAAEHSQPLRRSGQLKAARERLLVCSDPQCPRFVRADCLQWLAEVEKVLPSVVVRAVDASGAEVSNVRVIVDGQSTTASNGVEIFIDPGSHVFRFEHDGSEPVERTLSIRGGELHRSVPIMFSDTKAGDAGSSRRHPTAPGTRLRRAVPAILFAGAGVSLAIASYFWISGLGDRGSLSSTCASAHACSSSSVDSAHGKLVAGDILGGVGIALAGAGTWLYLTRPPAPDARSTGMPGGAMLRWEGRF